MSGGIERGYPLRTISRYQFESHWANTLATSAHGLPGRGCRSRSASTDCWLARTPAPISMHIRDTTSADRPTNRERRQIRRSASAPRRLAGEGERRNVFAWLVGPRTGACRRRSAGHGRAADGRFPGRHDPRTWPGIAGNVSACMWRIPEACVRRAAYAPRDLEVDASDEVEVDRCRPARGGTGSGTGGWKCLGGTLRERHLVRRARRVPRWR